MKRHGIAAALRAAFPVSIPVLAGYIFLGTAYGVLMAKIGYGPVWTAVFSVMILGGTIQFISTGLLVLDYSPVNAFVISVLINARHLFYGFSMLERYSGTGWKKPFLAFWLTDETFSLVCSDNTPPDVDKDWFRFFVSGLDYLYWIAGSVLGNVAGNLFAFDSTGIDFVMTSLFTVIVINQWREARTHFPAIAGFLLSLACLAVFGPERFLIPSMVLIVAALMLARGKLENLVRPGEDCA